jgi:hypothetical protein
MNTKTKLKTEKNNKWFIKIRSSYLPNSALGWLTYIPFVAYLAFSVIAAFKDTSHTLIAILIIVPNWVAAAAIMTFIASNES